jgi:SAM-dependent methyltransferase
MKEIDMADRAAAASHHETMVEGQFGPRADNYVASRVHAEGGDLARMAEIAAGHAGGRIADLGSGGGHVSFAVAPHAREVVACDLSDGMLAAVTAEAGRRGLGNVTTRRASVAALPFPDASFDLVMSRFSAHHWDDVGRGLAEARRIVRAGAPAVFADVVTPGRPLLDTMLQAIELLRDPSHVRNLSLAEWCAALAGAGFSVTAVRTARLRLEFGPWIERIGTPKAAADAIRALQAGAPDPVRRHFALEADGTFTLDTALIEAVAA